jgi:hypothetical protein
MTNKPIDIWIQKNTFLMKDLSDKESDEILCNMARCGCITKKKEKMKELRMHNEFKKGWRLSLCQSCGYPTLFIGCPFPMCECKNPKRKIYTLKDLSKFIIDSQNMWFKCQKKNKKK